MEQYFYELADHLNQKRQGDEVLLANFDGEQSDFVRLSRSSVRQAGSVTQWYFSLELIDGPRHVRGTTTVTGQADADRTRAEQLLAQLRDALAPLPEDPYLLYSTEVRDSRQIGRDRLGDSGEALDAILAAGQGRDMVAIYAQGGIYRGFANSLGQKNWFSTHSFGLDWTFYHANDKAVKATYAGFEWNADEFSRKVQAAAEQLEILARPAKTIEPGQYRVYLAPAALKELLGILSWGGFGLKAHRTKTTSLLKMIEDGAALSPSITLLENNRESLSPNFQAQGFSKPDQVTLIAGGRYRDCLVSARSAKEYGEQANAGGEYPVALDLAGGDLRAEEVLAQLDTGVYVNTLWYLNYSDRPACRITGLTRFATFWVAGGRIEAPLNVMRFDETIYRVLGENLIGLTGERDFLPSTDSYGARSTESVRVPGAIVAGFRLTL